MKHLLLITILFISAKAFTQTVFQKRFETGGYGQKIISTGDNGYAILGSIYNHISLIKLDSNYNQEWSRNIEVGLNIYENVTAVLKTQDKGVLITGYYYQSVDSVKSFIIKLDKKGRQEWAKIFYSGLKIFTKGIIEVDNRDLVVACSTYDDYAEHILFLHLDRDGNLLENKFYGKSIFSVTNIVAEDGGGFTIFGDLTLPNSVYFPNNDYFPFIASFDKNANLRWAQKILVDANSQFSYAFTKSFVKTKDGGYGIVVTTGLAGQLMKTNNKGELQWSRIINHKNEEEVNDLKATEDGGLVMAGYTNNNIFISKTTNKGQDEWSKILTSEFYSSGQAKSIVQTKDNGYMLTGAAWFNYPGYSGMVVIKVDSSGSSCGSSIETNENVNLASATSGFSFDSLPSLNINVSDIYPVYTKGDPLKTYCSNINSNTSQVLSNLFQHKTDAALFPNPAKDYLQVKLNNARNTNAEIEVIGMNGKILITQKKILTSGTNTIYLNIAFLNSGYYFLKILTNDGQEVLKFIKQE